MSTGIAVHVLLGLVLAAGVYAITEAVRETLDHGMDEEGGLGVAMVLMCGFAVAAVWLLIELPVRTVG